MFLFTVTKPGLRQAGALALCAVCLAGTVTAAVRLAGKSVAASATVQTTIENTQDIGTYFTGYGFEVDLSPGVRRGGAGHRDHAGHRDLFYRLRL